MPERNPLLDSHIDTIDILLLVHSHNQAFLHCTTSPRRKNKNRAIDDGIKIDLLKNKNRAIEKQKQSYYIYYIHIPHTCIKIERESERGDETRAIDHGNHPIHLLLLLLHRPSSSSLSDPSSSAEERREREMLRLERDERI